MYRLYRCQNTFTITNNSGRPVANLLIAVVLVHKSKKIEELHTTSWHMWQEEQILIFVHNSKESWLLCA